MRARIAGMTVLVGIVALSTSFVPVPLSGGQYTTSGTLTDNTLDCAVGNAETCLDVASHSAAECYIDFGILPGEEISSPYEYVVAGYCTAVGTWSGLTCAWDWFTNLF